MSGPPGRGTLVRRRGFTVVLGEGGGPESWTGPRLDRVSILDVFGDAEPGHGGGEYKVPVETPRLEIPFPFSSRRDLLSGPDGSIVRRVYVELVHGGVGITFFNPTSLLRVGTGPDPRVFRVCCLSSLFSVNAVGSTGHTEGSNRTWVNPLIRSRSGVGSGPESSTSGSSFIPGFSV